MADALSARLSWRCVVRAALPLVAAALLLVGCGGDDEGATGEPAVALSAEAQRGRQLYGSKGCASCHSVDGRDAAGPTWKNLAGSTVTLEDGRKVVADDDYLRRAISDPWAERVKGYGTVMPRNALTDDEVSAVVAYIRAISPDPSASRSAR
ncbi:MAG: cytochrome c [Actinobacteria bacterium]|nr:cytochrome c [Actinomycetota bacterium]